ncbi:MAG TPA: hypothetical protein VH062_29415 [Polyangiaceae bacterium]|jgi:hypothetical protein|nr:hypothetical protein [Polyangiaceae bacterium]
MSLTRTHGSVFAVFGVALSWNVAAYADTAAPGIAATQATPATTQAAPAPSSSPVGISADTSCYPPCRAGYLCRNAACVSMCNPPCPAGEACVDGTRCEREASPPSVMEPPPPPLEPMSFADRDYSAVAFHLGFGGSVKRSGVNRDLDTTLGFNLRGDIPVFRYMVIGPLLNFGAWRPDVSGASRNYYLDVDVFLRGRIPIQLDKIGLQLWAGVPIGLTLDFLSDQEGTNLDGFGLGWNFGVMFGGAIHFTNRFGMFTEIGWLQHRFTHDASSGSGSTDFRVSQGVWNIGFILGD